MPTYNPEKKCETAPILRQLKVESAAKKRNFRMEERQRFAALTHAQTEMNRVERENNRVEKERVCFKKKGVALNVFVINVNVFRREILLCAPVHLQVQAQLILWMWMRMIPIKLLI